MNACQSGGSSNSWRGHKTRAVVVAVSTAVCLALVFHTVDVGDVGRALSGARLHYLALAGLLLLGNLLVAMVRFRVVLDRCGYVLDWRRLHGAFCVGLLGNQFALNIIGQSVGRASALTSSGVPFGATIVATLVERILAAAMLAVAGLASVWFLLPRFGFEFAQGGAYFFSLTGTMALAALATVAVSYRRGAASRAVVAVVSGIERFWLVGLLTIVVHVFMLGGYVVMLLALGLETATLEVLGAVLVVMFAASLPISLSGWGIRELSAVAVLGVIGVAPSIALAAALVVGFLSLGVNLTLALPGLFFVPGRNRSPAEGTRSARGSSEWNARLVMGFGVLTAVAVYFQVRLQSGDDQIAANAADPFALMGLGILALLLADSRERFASLPQPLVRSLLALSLLLACGLVLGYANFGLNSWALINRGLGWLVILGYVSLGLSVALVGAEQGRRLVLRVFVAAGTAIAVQQLVLLIVRQLGSPLPPEAFIVPVQGYVANVNAFAFQMTITAVASVVADRLGLLGTRRRWLATILFLTGLAVYFSASRAGIGMFVLMLVLSVVFSVPAERWAVLATSALATAGAVLAATAIVNLPRLGGASGSGRIGIRTSVLDPHLDLERWQIYVEGWHLWLERPIFGNGLGAYVESQLVDPGPLSVFHSVPLWLMAEMGVVGLVVGIAAFGCLVLGAHRLSRDSVHRAWGAGLLMALIGWGAASQLHDFAFQRSLWFFLGLAFGLLPVAGGAKPRRGARPRS